MRKTIDQLQQELDELQALPRREWTTALGDRIGRLKVKIAFLQGLHMLEDEVFTLIDGLTVNDLPLFAQAMEDMQNATREALSKHLPPPGTVQ